MRDAPTTLNPVRPPTVTRRRALALGAAAGLGSLLRVPAPAAWAAPSRAARARSFALDVPGSAFRGGRLTGVLRAPRRFDLLGAQGAGVIGSGLEVRVRRRGGEWSRWAPLGHGAGHGPDSDRGAARATDPVWTGAAHELQLRSRRPLGGVRLRLVAVPPAGRAERGRARAAAVARPAQAPGTPPPIIGRDAWNGGRSNPRTAPSYGEVQVAFVHHTVTANDYAPEASAGIVLSICRYHRDTNGWNDVGYNFLVDQYGQVFEGRAGGVDAAVIGAQAQGYNRLSTGVAIIGTHGDVPISEAAMRSTAQLLGWKLSLHGVPTEGQVVLASGGGSVNRYPHGAQVTFERISGHRDGDKTACPGNALYAQLPQLRRRARALAGPVAQRPRITMAAASRAIEYGASLELSGVVRAESGLAVGGARVSIQKQGKTRWVTIAHATTADDGRWRASVPWRRAGRVRARARVNGSAVVVSPETAVAVVPVLKARAAARRIRAGSMLLVTGRVRPVGPVTVRVERQTRGGRWVRTADVRLRPRRSDFAARVRLRRAGLYRLTPRTGTASHPVTVPAIYVRAVRRLRNGGLSAESGPPAPPTGGARPA
jgi:hypothetical protein